MRKIEAEDGDVCKDDPKERPIEREGKTHGSFALPRFARLKAQATDAYGRRYDRGTVENEPHKEADKAFDFNVCFAPDLKNKEPGLKGIIADCKRFPVMAPFQLVIIKEAQSIENWAPIEDYLQHPVPTTVLVLVHKHKKIDKRKSVFKQIAKVGVSFESAPLKDSEYGTWVAQYLKQHGYSIAPQNLALLTESLGQNLNLIANELEKFFINLPPGSAISDDDIEKYIGINKDYNVFKLGDALFSRDPVRTRKLCIYARKHPKEFPVQLIIPQLYKQFAKVLQVHDARIRQIPASDLARSMGINPYFLRQYEGAANTYAYKETSRILNTLLQYDAKSKGVDADIASPDLIDELCFRILHAI